MKHVLCFLVILALFACMFAMPADGDKKDPPTPPKSPNAMAYFGKAVADWTTGMEKLIPGNWQ